VATILALGVIALQVAGKVDFHRLYLGSGVEYAKESSAAFYNFPWKLLFREYGSHGLALYLLSAVLLVAFLRKAPVFRPPYFLLLWFNGLFFVIHLVLRSFTNSHHFYFLTAPFLLGLVVGLRCVTRGGRRHRIVISLLLGVIALGSLQFSAGAWRLEKRAERFRAALEALEPGCILTDFVVHNEVAYATGRGAHRLLIVRPDDLVDVTNLPLPDLLKLQVDLGGLATSGISSWLYAERIGDAMSEGSPPLDEQLESLAGDCDYLYYVLPQNRTTLYPEEVRLFRRYRLERFIRPSIYRFVHTGAENEG
jgi:hypothetical protein